MTDQIMSDSHYAADQFGPIIPWTGGKCPVDPNAIVRLHFRGRGPYVGEAIHKPIPKHLQGSIWKHAPAPGRDDPAFDVIAYQVAHG